MLSSACSDLGDLIMSNIENAVPIDPAEKTSPILNEKGTGHLFSYASRDARS
jgi:hypothetical protein